MVRVRKGQVTKGLLRSSLALKTRQNKGKLKFLEGTKLFRSSSVPFPNSIALSCDHLVLNPEDRKGPRDHGAPRLDMPAVAKIFRAGAAMIGGLGHC